MKYLLLVLQQLCTNYPLHIFMGEKLLNPQLMKSLDILLLKRHLHFTASHEYKKRVIQMGEKRKMYLQLEVLR